MTERQEGGQGAPHPIEPGQGPAETLREALRYAILAPSRHNAQPWFFEIAGPTLRVYGDWRRSLPAGDPQGRELVMACGAALLNAELAARQAGLATSVEQVAGSRKDGLLARLTLEEPREPSEDDGQLFTAIPLRHTNRLSFDPRPVPPGLVTALARDAAACETTLRTVEGGDRATVAELVGEGDRLAWANGRFRAELASWSRSNEPGELDGMPGYAHGYGSSASALHKVLVRLRGASEGEERRDRVNAREARALLALCTRGDAPADWLAAGIAMQRMLLRAAATGLSASYFSNAVEVPSVREKLRGALGERGHPQLLMRLGFGAELRATPRRPVALVLRSFSRSALPQALARAKPGAPSGEST